MPWKNTPSITAKKALLPGEINSQSRSVLLFKSEIGHLRRFQLKRKLVSDKRNKFGIRRFSLGIADGIAEEALEGIQVTSVPGYFDGMADGSFHTAGCGLEGLGYLGVEHLGDGIGVLTARLVSLWMRLIWKGFCEGLKALFVAQFTTDSLGL